MATRVFLENSRCQLSSDPRDVMVDAQHHDDVMTWCKQHGVMATSPVGNYTHDLARQAFNVNLWRIRDETQRALFILRWA